MCVFEYRHTFIVSLSTLKARIRWQQISCLYVCVCVFACVFVSHVDVLFIGTICGANHVPVSSQQVSHKEKGFLWGYR